MPMLANAHISSLGYLWFSISKIKAFVDFGSYGYFICNFLNDVANYGNDLKKNYIARNFKLVKEELALVRLFKLQAKALLGNLQSSFLVLVYYM